MRTTAIVLWIMAGIVHFVGMFITSSAVDDLRRAHPEEWRRLGKPQPTLMTLFPWWFAYVICGSYRRRVTDENALSWLRINRGVYTLVVALASCGGVFFL